MGQILGLCKCRRFYVVFEALSKEFGQKATRNLPNAVPFFGVLRKESLQITARSGSMDGRWPKDAPLPQ